MKPYHERYVCNNTVEDASIHPVLAVFAGCLVNVMKPYHERYVCNNTVKDASIHRLVEYVDVDAANRNDWQLNFNFHAPVQNDNSVYVQCYSESTNPFEVEERPVLVLKVPSTDAFTDILLSKYLMKIFPCHWSVRDPDWYRLWSHDPNTTFHVDLSENIKLPLDTFAFDTLNNGEITIKVCFNP